MLHWKVWNYFVISHLWRNLIGFFEKCEIFVILIWLAKVKCHLRGCHRKVVGRVFNFGRGRRRSSACFFELEREQPACFLIATCWQNTKNIKRRCSVFSKVETLAACCESGTVSACSCVLLWSLIYSDQWSQQHTWACIYSLHNLLQVSGPSPIPPRYAFGVYYSRYHAYNDVGETVSIAATFDVGRAI